MVRAATALPKRIGHFQVLEAIGQGGMGVVYLARQPALDRDVVLKRVRRELLDDPTVVQRFQREARAAATVHHQNVVTIYDCFTHRGDHYIAQEWVHGCDLQFLLAECGRLEVELAGTIALEIARGLEAIHAQGVIHRDLKPANVLIGREGEVKIADFGIAVEVSAARGLTLPGTTMGSLPYMSPEQLCGRGIDRRSDLFNLGILLYEMLTGFPPFVEPDTPLEVEPLLKAMQERPPRLRDRRPDVPRWLDRLVLSLLAAKPTRRPADAAELRRALEARLGAVSASDCHAAIAVALAAKGIVEEGERTRRRPMPTPPRRLRPPRWRRTAPRWSYPLVGSLALLGLAWANDVRGFIPMPGGPELREPAQEVAVSPVEAVVPATPAGVTTKLWIQPDSGTDLAQARAAYGGGDPGHALRVLEAIEPTAIGAASPDWQADYWKLRAFAHLAVQQPEEACVAYQTWRRVAPIPPRVGSHVGGGLGRLAAQCAGDPGVAAQTEE